MRVHHQGKGGALPCTGRYDCWVGRLDQGQHQIEPSLRRLEEDDLGQWSTPWALAPECDDCTGPFVLTPRIIQEINQRITNGKEAVHGSLPEFVAMAREHLKGSLMLALEQTSSRMSNLARQEIYLDRPQSLTETLRRVSAVTAEQVHRLGRELMRDRRLGLAAIGRVRRLRLSPEALRL